MEGVHKDRIIADNEETSLLKFCRDYGIRWTALSDTDRLVCIQIILGDQRSQRTHKANQEFKQTFVDIFKQINEREAKNQKAREAQFDTLIKKLKDNID